MGRALVTGDRGFVGSRAARTLEKMGYEVARLAPGCLRDAGEDRVAEWTEGAGADVIVHTAAISDTGYCEEHGEESWRANVMLPLYIVRHAGGAKVILFSSDQVYNGCRGVGPFDEDEPLCPRTVYARHKLEMERRALEILPECVILRAGWMYDLPGEGTPAHPNLLTRMIQSRETGERLAFSGTDHRGVTWTEAVTENLEAALRLGGGVYNFGAENGENMYETGRRMARMIGAPEPERRDGEKRSLLMDMTKGKKSGLNMGDTISLWERCLSRYALGG